MLSWALMCPKMAKGVSSSKWKADRNCLKKPRLHTSSLLLLGALLRVSEHEQTLCKGGKKIMCLADQITVKACVWNA